MRIARLDLFGFKSFVDRTTIHFGHGISCVVGPNGSGKSNVVDALKWCLGEQSARSLRGGEMTDVIFAGSEDRRPVGFAEVQLTLRSDADEPFPGDYAALHEVQVGRRLHRTGASEYLINQARVRRRDVVELLMDSGIGNNLYSFIEQGEIDKVITATPPERRRVIDEAAGISRYKMRRAEALARLESTSSQLDRASDVVDEMRLRLSALERQVVRAAEYRRVATLVRQHELLLAVAKAHGLDLERRALREEEHEVQLALEGAEAQLESQARRLAERRAEAAVHESTVGQLRDQLAELDAHVREQEATRRLHDQRRVELESQVARSREDVGLARGDEEVARREVSAQQQALDALQGRLGEVDREVEGQEQRLTESRATMAGLRETAAGLELELQKVAEQRQQLATRRAALAARREATDSQTERIALEIRGLREERSTTAGGRERVVQRLAGLESQREEASVAAADASLRHVRAETAVTSAEDALAEAQRAREERFASWQAEARRVQERGRRWIAAAEALERASVARIEAAWRERDAEAARSVADDEERRVATARSEAEKRVSEEVERAERRLSAAAEARARAESRVDEARRRLTEIDDALRGATADRAECEGRQVAVRARLAVDAAVDDGERLIDRFATDERPGVVDRLGSRALAPLVADAVKIVAAAAAREDGVRRVVWFRPDGAPPASASAPWLAELSAGLRRFTEAPGPVAGPGYRIDGEGFVVLGPAEDLSRLAEQDVSLQAELDALGDAIAHLTNQRDVAEAALADATVARTTADRSWKAAEERVTRERASARAEVARAEREATEATRSVRDDETMRRTEARERAIAEARAAAEARLDRLRADAEAVLAPWLVAPAARVDTTALEAEVRRVREAARIARDTSTAARADAAERAREWERAEAERQAAERDIVRLDAEITRREAEAQRLGGERGTIGAEEAESGRAWDELSERSVALHTRLEELREEMARRGAEMAEQEGVLRAAEERRTAARTEQAGVVGRLEGARERLERAAATIVRAEDRARQSILSIAEAVRARDEAATTADEASTQRGAVFDAYQTARARLATGRAEVSALEEEQRAAMAETRSLAQRAEGIAERLRTTGAELEVLRQRMSDRYQTDLGELLAELRVARGLELGVPDDVAEGLVIGDQRVPPVCPLRLDLDALDDEARIVARVRELERLRTALQGFGTVNVAALEEFRDLERRYSDIEGQRRDLEESVRSIQAAITKLNRECRERFREAFQQVDDHFRSAYPRLVGGGQARLALTDEEDLLECGVDIFVQPPGKRLQNLQLLSGGEKAMTAIALLIALFRVKPSPFCVLDEVDAPLDEANGARFNEMLREMASQSQFLVVTHNRKTMECADTLFGVTMAKPGVSRLVSVQL